MSEFAAARNGGAFSGALSAANSLSPVLLTAEERLDELAAILAAGLVRLRSRKRERKPSNFSTLRDNSLDFKSSKSVHAGVARDSENRHAD
jgi:hypothetical protein